MCLMSVFSQRSSEFVVLGKKLISEVLHGKLNFSAFFFFGKIYLIWNVFIEFFFLNIKKL